MDAVTEPAIARVESKRRFARTSVLEIAVVALVLAAPLGTYLFVTHFWSGQLFSPGVAALLLLANLLPCVALIVLVGRRIAIRRAAQRGLAERGRLHVR